MTALTLTPDVLESLRQRRSAGERVSALAAEVGVAWQKLEKALRHGLSATSTRKTRPRKTVPTEAPKWPTVDPDPAPGTGSLIERYRPGTLGDIFGQSAVVSALSAFAKRPYRSAFLFEGETGTGKTSAAFALAHALGCDVEQGSMGGVNVIASGDQTADSVREQCAGLRLVPMTGSGWKVLVVNECDRMSPQAEAVWLDRLEDLPLRTVIVFSTNSVEKLSQRFLDRCRRVTFEGNGKKLARSAANLLSRIWMCETGEIKPREEFQGIVRDSTDGDGRLSFRRAVQGLAPLLDQFRGCQAGENRSEISQPSTNA